MRVYRGKGNCDLLNRSGFPSMGLSEPPGNYSSGNFLLLFGYKKKWGMG
jgi:hypothetical protein